MPNPGRLRPLLDRVADKFTVGDGCWEWTASKDGFGYGQIGAGRRGQSPLKGHRVLYELLVGPIPPGLVLDHLCRNPGCVRPDHVEPVTQQTNVRRGRIAEFNKQRAVARTHCKHGHPFTPENTRQRPDGQGRLCIICARAACLEYYYRRRM